MKTLGIVAIASLCCARPAAAQLDDEASHRMFGVLPNYSTVEDADRVPAITTKQTFHMAAQNSFDPFVFPFVGVVATMGQGRTSAPYAQRYATALADNSIGNFMTSAVFPAVFGQDPRYFERREGGVWRRAGYALTRSVVTRTRIGGAAFNYSEVGGNAAAAVLSNAYYPSSERSVQATLARWGMQMLWDSVSNDLKEFWPDIRQKLHKR